MRMSTDHQKYSIQNQSATIALYAAAHGIAIVRSYVDAGKSGLSVRHRDALKELLAIIQSGRADFNSILVYDVSRWGRFLDADESAHYEYLCKRAGIQIRYCAEQFENDNSTTSNLLKALKRTMAGEFSRELSVKTFAGQSRLFQLGYRMGGPPGFAFRRQLVDENDLRRQMLAKGQEKSILTDRTKLVLGPLPEIVSVHKMFDMFTKQRVGETAIMRALNKYGPPPEPGEKWTYCRVHTILTSPKYMGDVIWSRSQMKLCAKRTWNPPSDWLHQRRSPIISAKQFELAQKIIRERNSRNVSNELLLQDLRGLLVRKGYLSAPLIQAQKEMVCVGVYRKRFGGMHNAFRLVGFEPRSDLSYLQIRHRQPQLLHEECDRLIKQLRAAGAEVDESPPYPMFSINRTFTIQIALLQRSLHEGEKWEIPLRRSPVPDILLAGRVSKDCTVMDYFLLPLRDLGEERLRIRTYNRLNIDIYRAFDFKRLIDSARRVQLTGAQNTFRYLRHQNGDSVRQKECLCIPPRPHYPCYTTRIKPLREKLQLTYGLLRRANLALGSLIEDDSFANLLRAEFLGSLPRSLWEPHNFEELLSQLMPERIEHAAEGYGQKALDCTVVCRYIESILKNTQVTRYLEANHRPIFLELQSIVEDSQQPSADETEREAMKRRLWTITRASSHMQDLLRAVRENGPQVLSRNGKPTAVVVSLRQWKTLTKTTHRYRHSAEDAGHSSAKIRLGEPSLKI